MNPRERRLAVGIVVTALVALVAIVVSSIALAQRQSSAPGEAGPPASGVYLNGASDRPHFYLVLTNLGEGRVRGSVDFRYQDGQTTLVFTFGGTTEALRAGATSGALTLTPEKIPSESSSQLVTPLPSALSATYDAGEVELGECDAYLEVADLAACQFSLSTTSSP